MKTKHALFLLLFLSWGGSASAFPYAIDSYVNGAEMAGMEVTVFFDTGSNETATWIATGADSGGAFGADWSLIQSGDTFNQPNLDPAWTLTNSSSNKIIGKLRVNAWVAEVFFDVLMDFRNPLLDEGTPGSDQGRPFTDDGTLDIESIWDKYPNLNDYTKTVENTQHVTYVNQLSAPDLYGGLEVKLGSTGLGAGQSFQFMIDTDRIQIPESPLFALLALGFAGFVFQQRARRMAA